MTPGICNAQVDIRTIDFWGFPQSHLRGVFVRGAPPRHHCPSRGGPPVDAGANDPVFASRKGGHLTERAVNGMVKRTAGKAGISEAVSPHWLRHAHGSHAIDRGASLPEAQSTVQRAPDLPASVFGPVHIPPSRCRVGPCASALRIWRFATIVQPFSLPATKPMPRAPVPAQGVYSEAIDGDLPLCSPLLAGRQADHGRALVDRVGRRSAPAA
jgi:hypothetical protein